MRIQDLAETMIEHLTSRFGREPKSIAVKTIGMKKGEKMEEGLFTSLEQEHAVLRDGMIVIAAHPRTTTPLPVPRLLSKKEIWELLKDMNWEEMRIS